MLHMFEYICLFVLFVLLVCIAVFVMKLMTENAMLKAEIDGGCDSKMLYKTTIASLKIHVETLELQVAKLSQPDKKILCVSNKAGLAKGPTELQERSKLLEEITKLGFRTSGLRRCNDKLIAMLGHLGYSSCSALTELAQCVEESQVVE